MAWWGVVTKNGGGLCRTASLPCLSERPFRARPSGTLLEFLQLRSDDRRASVSSSFPSRPSLGGHPAPSATCAQPPTQPRINMKGAVNISTRDLALCPRRSGGTRYHRSYVRHRFLLPTFHHSPRKQYTGTGYFFVRAKSHSYQGGVPRLRAVVVAVFHQ